MPSDEPEDRLSETSSPDRPGTGTPTATPDDEVPARPQDSWDAVRRRVIGLGERSVRKTYYPELRQRLGELERFRALLDQSLDAIFLLETPSLRIVDATESAVRQLQLDRSTLLRLTLAELVPAGVAAAIATAADDRAGDPVGTTVSTEFEVAGGTSLPVEISLRPVAFGNDNYLVAVARDLTERRELEARLLQAAKMESLGRLAGGIAHDFNNLLTAILGNGELARYELAPDDPVQEFVDEIVVAGERARDLVRQLLIFARRQTIVPIQLDLNEVITSSESMLRRLLGTDVEMTVELAPDLAPVVADAGQIVQLLVNLTVNARDAMPDGGRLLVRTANVGEADPAATGDPGPGDGLSVELAVSDSGTGMTEATMAHLFEPFFTTKDVGAGTGLGLATCHGIVRQAGGTITVTSAPGRGSTFRVRLPTTTREPTASTEREVRVAASLGTERILVVEDDAAIRRLAVAGLASRGYDVLEAVSGTEALEIAAHWPFDLVVSDIVMPGLNGVELGRRLLEVQPGARLILASGHPRTAVHGADNPTGTEDAALESGWAAPSSRPDGVAHAFLWKPYTPEQLATLVRKVLDRSASTS